MADGKIAAPMPSLVKPEMVIAERVANIAAPAATSNVFDKLAANGSLNINAPSPASMGLGGAAGTPYGTSKLQGLAAKTSLNNERYKSGLPNLGGPPKQGFGTSMQRRGRAEQEVAGGRGSGTHKGNTVFVDDKNWPVTLKEIIGSKMLSKEQLQMASIESVKKLFNTGLNNTRHQGSASVGTKEENEELYYMAQRFMLEGFIRGVDVTKELKKEGGLNIAIRDISFVDNPKNNLGLNSTATGKKMDSVNFNARHWRKMSDIEKYTLFAHELGHNLLNRPELDSKYKYDIMGDGPYGVSKKLMSSKDMYNRIMNDHFNSATNKGTIAISKLGAGQGTSEFDPSWFPQLSGEAVKIDGGNYTPGQGSHNGGDDGAAAREREIERAREDKRYEDMFNLMRESNQMQMDNMNKMMESQMTLQRDIANKQFQQQTIASIPGPQSGPLGGGGGSAGLAQLGPSGMGPTMMAGGGGGFESTKAFAAGLANLSNSGDDLSGAGMLLASG